MDHTTLKGHLRNHSSMALGLGFQRLMEERVFPHFGALGTPEFPRSIVDEIYGLEKSTDQTYLRCATCFRCYAAEKQFKVHSRSGPSGKKEKCGGVAEKDCVNVQRFERNNSSSWFAVRRAAVREQSPILHWGTYSAATDPLLKSMDDKHLSVPANYRVIDQFLRKERWFGEVGDRKHEDLIPLAEYSSKDERYGNLHKHIGSFFTEVQRNINGIWMRRLVGTRPGAEHAITFQVHHADISAASRAKYARVLAGSIMLCIRTVCGELGGYSIVLPDAIVEATKDLMGVLEPPSEEDMDAEEGSGQYFPLPCDGLLSDRGWLLQHSEGDEDSACDDDDGDRGFASLSIEEADDGSNPTTPAVQVKLKVLLELLFKQKPCDRCTGPFHSPIAHYLLISSLLPKGAWSAATVITQRIAAILWAGRVTFASILQTAMSADKTLTVHEYAPVPPCLRGTAADTLILVRFLW